MSVAPKRIWSHPTEREPVPARERKNAKWRRGKWKDHNSNAHGDVEYVRADIIEELERQRFELAGHKINLRAENAALEADLAKAIKALEFYSNPDHWNPPYAEVGTSPFSVMDEDEGEIARTTLAELKGEHRGC